MTEMKPPASRPDGGQPELAPTCSKTASDNGRAGSGPAAGEGAVSPPPPTPAPPPSAAGGRKGGWILVMDDEEMVRVIAGKMLTSLGYRVAVCDNGSEAVSLFAAAKDAGTPFQAVIIDLTIEGGMGGEEAARHILALDPQARLVVSSGYANNAILSKFRVYGFRAALPKPYRLSDMASVLSEVLQNKAG